MWKNVLLCIRVGVDILRRWIQPVARYQTCPELEPKKKPRFSKENNFWIPSLDSWKWSLSLLSFHLHCRYAHVNAHVWCLQHRAASYRLLSCQLFISYVFWSIALSKKKKEVWIISKSLTAVFLFCSAVGNQRLSFPFWLDYFLKLLFNAF